MPGHLPKPVKEARTRQLIALGDQLALAYHQRWLGRTVDMIPEETGTDGLWRGYTPEYIQVRVADCPRLHQGENVTVRLTAADADGMLGEIV